jgi:hypothetical protein
MEKTKMYLTLLLSCGLSASYAQEGIVVAGGDTGASNGTLSFSVGQTFYIPQNNILQVGIQQPYEIFILGIGSQPISAIKIYPNPTSDYVIMEMDILKNKLRYEFWDMLGRRIDNQSISESKTQMEVKNLPSGTYFLHIIQENQVIQTFKVVKK